MPITTGGRRAADSIPVPKLRDVSARYAALDNRRAELIVEIAQLTDAENAAWIKLISAPPSGAQRAENRIDALLGELLGPVSPEPASATGLAEEHFRIGRDIADRKMALRRLEQAMAAERMQASRDVCTAVRDRYRALAQEMITAAATFFEVYGRYDAFVDELNREDISWTGLLPDERPHWIANDRHDPTSAPGRYFSLAATSGFDVEPAHG